MPKRVITSIVLNVIAFIILFYSHTRIGSLFFLLIIDGIAAVGLYEFYSLVEKKGSTSLMAFGMVVGVLYCTFSFFTSDNPIVTLDSIYFDVCLVVIIIGFFFFQFLRTDRSSVIYNFGGTIAGMFYVAWLLAFSAKINYFPGVAYDGMWYIVMLVGIVKGGDSMAYLVGSRFGRTPLCPSVSPKKTYEGAIAQLVAGIIIAIIFQLVIFKEMTYIQAVVIGISISIVAQFGDLSESLLKRDAGIKDSGAHFPGLGGVLDLVDSILFTLPLLYYFMLFWLI